MLGRQGFPRACHAPTNTFTKRGRPLLAALLAAFVAQPLAALPTVEIRAPAAPIDKPALWVLSDSDTTIYLFGTFHALDDRTDWFARDVRAAFDSADELILEALIPSNPVELLASLSRASLAAPMVAGTSVVASAPGSLGASAGQTISAARKVGLKAERGADAVLRRTADAEGKPVDGLESFDFQLAMFAALPGAAPASRTAATQSQPDTGRVLLDMRTAWKRGDASRFHAILAGLEAQSPLTYQRLFVDRNTNWARWIADRMDRPGTVFVAVGTGHLIGRDSVQQKLATRGFTTTRIN